ncbi:MAG: molybdopterin-dependent oxidoreductase [Candidatus Thorarchaeota archaeon]
MPAKRIVRSSCRMCHGVCRVLVHLEGDRVVKITGDKDSPTNEGYICPKGAASPKLLYHKDRILHPMRRAGKRGENKWERITWDEALDEMADKLKAVKEESGSEYFAMMQGTGRPYESLTARFCNVFGTPNFTNVAHVCYFPRVMANISCMGHPQLPLADVHGFSGEFPSCVVMWG